jgi:hypothetical protein
MKDFYEEIQYKNKTYKLVFNLNVMENVQEEYGTLEKLVELISNEETEINAKAVIYIFTQMLNEGIDIANEENGTDDKMLTTKQVGRMITEIGLTEAAVKINKTVAGSTKGEEKNE